MKHGTLYELFTSPEGELFAIEDATSRFVREWRDMLTSSTPIRNCAGAAGGTGRSVRFAYEFPLSWETLEPTADASARHCGTCQRLVHLCRTRDEAEERARRGECITLASEEWVGLRREITSGCTGRPDPVAMWAERVFPEGPSVE
jgi:hypothetical protein